MSITKASSVKANEAMEEDDEGAKSAVLAAATDRENWKVEGKEMYEKRMGVARELALVPQKGKIDVPAETLPFFNQHPSVLAHNATLREEEKGHGFEDLPPGLASFEYALPPAVARTSTPVPSAAPSSPSSVAGPGFSVGRTYKLMGELHKEAFMARGGDVTKTGRKLAKAGSKGWGDAAWDDGSGAAG